MIFALGLATRTGWATRTTKGLALSGTLDLGRLDWTAACGRLGAWMADQITLYEPLLAAFEAPVAHAKAPNLKGAQLLGAVRAVCALREIATVGAAPAAIKTFIAGRGNAAKPDVAAAVEALGFGPKTADEADAIALLLYAETACGPQLRGAAA
jgi:Holliday junction resolvasome RuvABC endonuclease subunit